MIYGYARVSTDGQKLDLQIDALNKAGCEKIFLEQGVSGSKTSRPELDKMLAALQPGDTVVIWKLDRLGRSLQHLLTLAELFKATGVHFKSITDSIDTSSPVGRLIFQIFGAFAEFERECIRERVTNGVRASIKRGTVWNKKKRIPDGKPMSKTTAWRRSKGK